MNTGILVLHLWLELSSKVFFLESENTKYVVFVFTLRLKQKNADLHDLQVKAEEMLERYKKKLGEARDLPVQTKTSNNSPKKEAPKPKLRKKDSIIPHDRNNEL